MISKPADAVLIRAVFPNPGPPPPTTTPILACLTCFPAPTHLIQINGSALWAFNQALQKCDNDPFIGIRSAGEEKRLQRAV